MKVNILPLLMLFACPAPAADITELQQAFNAAASKAGPAVVSVQVIREEAQAVLEPDYFFGYSMPSEKLYHYKSAGVGSGVIVDSRGYVLTNNHVVQGAVRIKITTQDAKGIERSWPAAVAGTDPALDLALLKIKGDGPFPWLELNDSAALKVGDFVLAVGYPFGFKQTITSGIISALNASLPVEGRKYEKLIQTDAAINQGNSGGPLLNLKGEIIGINTAIASPTGVFAGMGFAVPAAEIKKNINDLIAGRPIRRGWLGVSLLSLDAVMARRFGLALPEGAIVNSSVEGSPAHKAGIRRGDVIITCNGSDITSQEDLFYQTYTRRPGDEVEIVYLRKGVRKKVKITLGERETPRERRGSAAKTGGDDGAVLQFEWEGVTFAYTQPGAEVTGVGEQSRLADYLHPGDVVRAVNGIAVDSRERMKKAFMSASLSQGVVFDMTRNGEETYLSVQLQ